MRIYWYWPFARPEELPLACATAQTGDQMTIQVIDRLAAPSRSPCERVVLLRDLPEVDRGRRSSPAWLVSRAGTYYRRARQRERAIASVAADVYHLQYLNRFTDWLLPRAHPLVMSVHDLVPHDSRLPPRAEQVLLTRAYRRADALVVHHRRLRQGLIDGFGVDSARIHVVPHQVFAYEDAEPTPLPERPSVLCFGSLRHNKGIDVLLHAIALMSDDVTFVFAGQGEPDIEQSLREAARRDNRIRLELSYVSIDRKIQLFRDASLVALPYRSFASQSGVLHDSYAHGRPVVATDVGALGDTVREDGTGVVVRPGDAGQLAGAISGLVTDRVALEGYAVAALQVRERRSPAHIGPLLRDVYQAVIR